MLKIYNSLSRKKEILKPLKKGKIKLFVCGPTVYDFSHLGHARVFIFFDVIAKYLRQIGFDVFYLQNITDIDDKIIKRAQKEKISPHKLAKRFEKEHFRAMKLLKVNSVTKYGRATDYIKEIISQIERLIKKGYGYKLEDGIYYDISKFKNYGKLSKRTRLQAEDAFSRIDQNKGKKNKGDFCLWKFSPPAGGPKEPKWKSPWGEGRPGWHIEDTAICEKHFGSQYDIHGGGRDLIFPHHEAEIAQMEAISGKPLAKYWIHCGLLTIHGRKMAKSLGNFITIENFLEKHGYNTGARALKLFFLKKHYKSPIDYTEKTISQIKRDLEKIDEFIAKLVQLKSQRISQKDSLKIPLKLPGGGLDAGRDIKALVLKTEKEFEKSMNNDFNTAQALVPVFHLINRGNWFFDRGRLSAKDIKTILKVLKKIDEVFGFIFLREKKEKIPQKILNLIKEREQLRSKENWEKADEIRKKIKKLGYWIEDTKEGTNIKKLKTKPSARES